MKTKFGVNSVTPINKKLKNGYTPAFIGHTDSSKNFNFDRQCSHYVQATTLLYTKIICSH